MSEQQELVSPEDVAEEMLDKMAGFSLEDGDLLILRDSEADDWTVRALSELRARLCTEERTVHIMTLDSDAELESVPQEVWQQYVEEEVSDE